MFDGSFKATRKVNMSGRRTPFATSSASASRASSGGAATKEQLMLEAKRTREERQEQKRRAAASTTIQALYRRVAAAAHARTAVFCALERELTHVVATVDIKTSALPTQTLASFLRQFWFAVGRDVRTNVGACVEREHWVGLTDVRRDRVLNVQTYIVVMLLVSCLRGATLETNFLAAPKDAAWLYQVTRLLESALRVLTTTRFASAMERASSPFVVVLETFTSRDAYAAVARATGSPHDATACVQTLLQKLAVHAAYGTFDALSDVIRDHAAAQTRPEDVERDRIADAVSTVASATLQLASDVGEQQQRELVRAFVRKTLLTPTATASPVSRAVLSKLRLQTDERQASAAFWQRALQELATVATTAPLTWHERAIALGNTLDLLQQHAFEPALVFAACSVMPAMISDSLVRWTFAVALPAPGDVEMLSPRRAPSARGSGDDETAPGVQALGAFASAVRAQLEQLSSATVSRRMLDAIAQDVDAPGAVAALRGFCATYASVLLGADRTYMLTVTPSFVPPARPVFSILSGVVMDPMAVAHSADAPLEPRSTLDRIWSCLERELCAAKATYAGAPASVMYAPAHLRMLVVFNAVYSHVLLGLDDETFFDRAWPLALDRVASVVAFLKTFIYDTCWNAASGSATAAAAPRSADATLFAAVTTSVKLFNQLYDRDCRRSFTSDGAWLWPAMPAIKETVDLASMEDDGDGDDAHDARALAVLLGSGSATSSPHARAALVLATIPQVFAFTDRVLLFKKLLDDEKATLGHMRSEFAGALQVRIKRDAIVDESYAFFERVCAAASPSVLKSRIKVTFVNAQGLEEAGIDGGGVFKEYIDALTKRAFSPEHSWFLATSEHLLHPNPHAPRDTDVLERFRFLGRVLAKAVYENILVEPQFAAFFLNKLLGKVNAIDDLRSLDPALYRHVMQLKHFDGNVDDLALTFSASETVDGRVVARDLVPNGTTIAVTDANRIRYIHVLAHYKLNVVAARESAAFVRGFRDLIPAKWIQLFSPSELQMLLGGSANTIDVDDWERHTTYGGGYHPSQRPVQWFWDIVRHDFDAADRAALLQFVTSCSRAPLLGFRDLSPPLCIHQVRTTDDDERLPSSATCMNLLKLPTYASRETMRRKLLYAIRANAGFDLS